MKYKGGLNTVVKYNKIQKWKHIKTYTKNRHHDVLKYVIMSLVTGVSRQTEYDWLDKNMTDWRLEVDLAVEYDWRRLPNNVTGGGA